MNEEARLAHWEELLRNEGARIVARGGLSAASLDRIWARCAAEFDLEPAWKALEATTLLRSLMEPICGWGTVEKTLALAQHRSVGFHDFLKHWSAALASICGSATGELVLSVGSRLAVE